MGTKISYCDETWNPMAGCSPCSPGCDNCYASRAACGRFLKNHPLYKGLAVNNKWTGRIRTCIDIRRPDIFDKPLRWRKPRTIFVCNMGDLFHEEVPFEFLDKVFNRMIGKAPQHTYLVLTKRPERMAEYIEHVRIQWQMIWKALYDFPLPNVYLGVTVCNQAEADAKIPVLLKIPCANRWLSIEPLLSEINIKKYLTCGQDGVKCNYEDKTSRRKTNESCPKRRTSNRCPRSNMENCDKKGYQGKITNNISFQNQEASCRSNNETGLFNDKGDVGWENDKRMCASSGMEILQRQDTLRNDNQSQERNQSRQSTEQSGIGHTIPTNPSHVLCSEKRVHFPSGGEKFNDQANRGECKRNAETQKNGGDIHIDSQGLQSNARHSVSNSTKNQMGTHNLISLIVIGCESGKNRRPCKLEWMIDVVEQCQAAGIKVLVKQVSINGRVSHNTLEWPEKLRVRDAINHQS